MEDNFFKDWRWGDGFGVIQTHYIYCALCFNYYYLSSTPDHQALDPRGWRPLHLKNWRKHPQNSEGGTPLGSLTVFIESLYFYTNTDLY